jgi:Fur family zinc uptake transcriptional regulator
MDSNHYLQAAEAHCERRGCKLTALRKQVLELVLRHQGVVKAYQVLADLQKSAALQHRLRCIARWIFW